MTKQQSLVIIVGCLVAVLMCVGVILLVQQSAQAVVGESDSANISVSQTAGLAPLC
ncbi:hypothetical protein [Paramicrobacterium chengjingii]|uniref:Na(+)-translocating NADH-quinone reductase subunit C n=1 Tax=Paramicrobacterium chengjingii TaxID=2769067 RepID=A0ABX6YG84_9MICO|nr:hypothetical protein [Microbacterium chengjingii]QPZ37456.1 hypothetical protein HCR76_11485 [Microbacterium chengjingii]